jgi:superfamily II DNA or RNA helicase
MRSYQSEAIESWCAAGGRGVVVLPTGAGKTRLAIAVIEGLNRTALILVPTRVLLHQWRAALREVGVPASGQWGDGTLRTERITVSTYHAALIHMRTFGGSFHLVVVDECHHFVTRSYASLLAQSTAPLALGLSATPPRDEGLENFRDAFGGIVFERRPADIQNHLAKFVRVEERVPVPSALARELVEGRKAGAEVLAQARVAGRMATPADVAKLLRGRRPMAQKWLAWLAAREALSRWEGLVLATELAIQRHAIGRFVVFAESTALAVRIACRLVVPCFVTGIDAQERTLAMQGFKEGRVRGVVSCRVLNEGFDLPGVDTCLIVGSVRSETEYVQRLGRALRKCGNERVKLVEILPDLPSSQRASALRGAWLAERFS